MHYLNVLILTLPLEQASFFPPNPVYLEQLRDLDITFDGRYSGIISAPALETLALRFKDGGRQNSMAAWMKTSEEPVLLMDPRVVQNHKLGSGQAWKGILVGLHALSNIEELYIFDPMVPVSFWRGLLKDVKLQTDKSEGIAKMPMPNLRVIYVESLDASKGMNRMRAKEAYVRVLRDVAQRRSGKGRLEKLLVIWSERFGGERDNFVGHSDVETS